MKRIGFWFFFTGTVYVALGMMYGIFMAISGDHTLAPMHAHLNLIGWATFALFGIYYTLTPQAGASTLAKVHFWLAQLGVILIVPGIGLAVNGTTEALAAIGSLVTLAAMLTFVFIVWKNGVGRSDFAV